MSLFFGSFRLWFCVYNQDWFLLDALRGKLWFIDVNFVDVGNKVEVVDMRETSLVNS